MSFMVDRYANEIAAAREQLQASQFKGALNICMDILKEKPNHVDALIVVGLASINLGAANTAELHFIEALRFQPNDADLHCNLGIALAMQCELKRAENAFKKAVNLQANNNTARTQLEQTTKERQRIKNKIQQIDKSEQVPKIVFSREEKEAGLPSRQTINEASSLFRHFGYLIIEDIFEKSHIEEMLTYFKKTEPSFFQQSQTDKGIEVAKGRTLIKTQIDGPFKDSAFYAPDSLYPVLHQLLGDTLIMLTLGTVVSLPDATEQHTHADHTPLFGDENLNRQVPPYAITVAVPLIDMNKVTGTTRMYEKTHLRRGSLTDSEAGRFIEPEVSAGSVLLFDYRIQHCGTANRSTNVRPLVCGVYCRPWFRDASNYFREEAMLISDDVYEQISPKYRNLFNWTRYGAAAN